LKSLSNLQLWPEPEYCFISITQAPHINERYLFKIGMTKFPSQSNTQLMYHPSVYGTLISQTAIATYMISQECSHSVLGMFKIPTISRVRVTLRLTVSQSVCLGVEPNFGQLTGVCFILEISFRQLQVCNFVVPSLTRGRVCKLLHNCFWALPEQSRRTHGLILLSQLRLHTILSGPCKSSHS
jgi:hypothetical protein